MHFFILPLLWSSLLPSRRSLHLSFSTPGPTKRAQSTLNALQHFTYLCSNIHSQPQPALSRPRDISQGIPTDTPAISWRLSEENTRSKVTGINTKHHEPSLEYVPTPSRKTPRRSCSSPNSLPPNLIRLSWTLSPPPWVHTWNIFQRATATPSPRLRMKGRLRTSLKPSSLKSQRTTSS